MGSVMFGKDEYFDERGKLIRSVDEDAKFGKIKPRDLPGIIENIGLFNTQTGENIFTEEPLPTDGRFTSRFTGTIEIYFIPAGINADGDPHANTWLVIFMKGVSLKALYSINGETGEYQYRERNWYRED